MYISSFSTPQNFHVVRIRIIVKFVCHCLISGKCEDADIVCSGELHANSRDGRVCGHLQETEVEARSGERQAELQTRGGSCVRNFLSLFVVYFCPPSNPSLVLSSFTHTHTHTHTHTLRVHTHTHGAHRTIHAVRLAYSMLMLTPAVDSDVTLVNSMKMRRHGLTKRRKKKESICPSLNSQSFLFGPLQAHPLHPRKSSPPSRLLVPPCPVPPPPPLLSFSPHLPTAHDLTHRLRE